METVTPPDHGTVTMFTTSWCGYCRRLKRQLGSEGIAYREVDIEEAATNPSLAQVRVRMDGARGSGVGGR